MKRTMLIFSVVAVLFLFLKAAFSGRIEVPMALTLGPVNLRLYSLIMLCAALAGYRLLMHRALRSGETEENVDWLFFFLLVGGFLGARVHHVLSAWDYYTLRPSELFAVWQGGLGWYGAVVGGFLGMVMYCIWKKRNTLLTLDLLAPAVALGQAIGRWGNFFNKELYGTNTDLPWKMLVETPQGLAGVHPIFLYESLLCLVLYLATSGESRGSAGRVFSLYAMGYASGRFFFETLRADPTLFNGLNVNQIMSLALLVTGLSLYIRAYRKSLIKAA